MGKSAGREIVLMGRTSGCDGQVSRAGHWGHVQDRDRALGVSQFPIHLWHNRRRRTQKVWSATLKLCPIIPVPVLPRVLHDGNDLLNFFLAQLTSPLGQRDVSLL